MSVIRNIFINQEQEKVPQAEALVLDLLVLKGKSCSGAEIAMSSNDLVSAASVYQLLNRLEKRGLVNRTETWDTTGNVPIRRVVYAPTDGIRVERKNLVDQGRSAQLATGKSAGVYG